MAAMKQPTEETELRSQSQGLDLLPVYPMTFAFLSLCLFAAVSVKMAYLAFDDNVRYWIGVWPMYIAFLPLAFIVLALLIHRIKGQPSRIASFIGLTGPSVLLLLGAYKISMDALMLSVAFGSTDCLTNAQMYKLGIDYKSALAFKSTCKPLANASDAPITMEDCADYEAALLKNPGWRYMAHLEKTTGCGGWCEAAKPIWAYPAAVQDPCSSVVAEALSNAVLYPSMQVAIYSIAVLFLATVGIAALGPKAAQQGLDW